MIQKTSSIILASIAFFSVAFILFVIYTVDTSTQRVNFLASVFVGEEKQEISNFVRCLNEKGVYFYGISGSSLTQEQLTIFNNVLLGDVFVDCREEETGEVDFACLASDIVFFPTWVFGDGDKKQQLLTINEISEITGCGLKDSNRYRYYYGIL